MKDSRFTGKFIYETILGLNNELKDLNSALNSIADDLGDSSLAFKLLEKAKSDKQRELNEALTQTYNKDSSVPFSF